MNSGVPCQVLCHPLLLLVGVAAASAGHNPPAGADVQKFEATWEDRKDKIILVGHSWGSILGFRTVKARPDLFYAFVAR